MGVDAAIHVAYPDREITEEEFDRALTFMKERWPHQLVWEHIENDDFLIERESKSTMGDVIPGVELSMGGMRYYGPGYERGDWPVIFGGLELARAMFPEATVYYGGDSLDHTDAMEVTPEYMAEIWAHYVGPNGNDYWKARNA